MINKYKKLAFSAFLAIFLISSNLIAHAESQILEAYALDTVAGFSTTLRTSQTVPNAKLTFQVKKPDGQTIQIPSQTNNNGVAYATLSDYHTRFMGEYSLSATLQDYSINVRPTTFKVFPSSVSSKTSRVYPKDQVVRDLNDFALVTVQLLDDYGNPIENHMVKLLAGSTNVLIDTNSNTNTTNKNGEVVFKVLSEIEGAVTLTAYDVSADLILSDRGRIAFYDSGTTVFANNYPGNFQYAASGASSLVDKLEFEEIVGAIPSGENLDFTVNALDTVGDIVTDYVGTIRFSVLSGNPSFVTLPDDYTFTLLDQGSHTFSLSLLFQQAGTYEIEARSVDNPAILGTYIFIVTNLSSTSPSSGNISIINPIAGTYSNNVQVISGVGLPGTRLIIYDNGVELAQVVAGLDGAFSYTSTSLVDGAHSVYVAQINDAGIILDKSAVINFRIDTSAPAISQITVSPDGIIIPGQQVHVIVDIPEQLAQAALIFADNIYQLTKNVDGRYEVYFTAPNDKGSYDMDFILVDQLGNESRFDNLSFVTVGDALPASVGQVSALIATPGDTRIVLNWVAPESTNPIRHYRIFYGKSPNQLSDVVDTFTNSSTWYIPNLTNGVDYYFTAIAVDTQGITGSVLSNIVKGTPAPPVSLTPPPDVLDGSAGGDELENLDSDVSDSGPEILWLIGLSLLGGFFYTNTPRIRRFFN